MRRDTISQLVVNGRFLTRRVTGVERYGHEILRSFGGRARVESTRRQGWTGHVWEQFILPTKLHADSILWSPANTGPLIVRNQALTIHDLSPLEHPEWFRRSFAAWYRLFLPILARRVRRVFTPSEYVKQKVVKRFGIRDVIVTPNGVDSSVFHPGATQGKFNVPDCYILFVGSLEPRKNVDLLLQAWHAIQDHFKETWLMIVGSRGHVFRSVSVSRQLERVCFLGYVEDEVLAGLYANASVVVLPSKEEGFGLPALEAMASGVPVIVSDGGALPEIVGEAGLIFKLECQSPEGTPGRCERSEESHRKVMELLSDGVYGAPSQDDINGLANTLRQGLTDADLRSALKEKGLARASQFPWQATAEVVWSNLHDL